MEAAARRAAEEATMKAKAAKAAKEAAAAKDPKVAEEVAAKKKAEEAAAAKKKVEAEAAAKKAADKEVEEAWNYIGDYYAERHKWEEAVQYYEKSRKDDQQCLYIEF